jgi:hypothetical protein
MMLLNIFQLIKIFENNKNSFLLFCDFFKNIFAESYFGAKPSKTSKLSKF